MSLMVFELQKHTYHKAIGFFFLQSYLHLYITGVVGVFSNYMCRHGVPSSF